MGFLNLTKDIMSKPVELYVTKNDEGEWLVWFPHPLGGMDVIGTFDNEKDARAFWQDQIDNADYE
jgi:hypothetical protein